MDLCSDVWMWLFDRSLWPEKLWMNFFTIYRLRTQMGRDVLISPVLDKSLLVRFGNSGCCLRPKKRHCISVSKFDTDCGRASPPSLPAPPHWPAVLTSIMMNQNNTQRNNKQCGRGLSWFKPLLFVRDCQFSWQINRLWEAKFILLHYHLALDMISVYGAITHSPSEAEVWPLSDISLN